MINKQVFRIKKNGEPNGKCFCRTPELIENYTEAISSNKKYDCHHRLETHFSNGIERPRNAQLSREELIALGMYFDRPASELIFLTQKEHHSLHNKYNKGRKLGPTSEETKVKISTANKGKKRSDETKAKISVANKGKILSEEQKRKTSESMRGHKVSEETKAKMAEKRKLYWQNKKKQTMGTALPAGYMDVIDHS